MACVDMAAIVWMRLDFEKSRKYNGDSSNGKKKRVARTIGRQSDQGDDGCAAILYRWRRLVVYEDSKCGARMGGFLDGEEWCGGLWGRIRSQRQYKVPVEDRKSCECLRVPRPK